MSALGYELVTEIDDDNPVLGDLRISAGRFARNTSTADSVAQACTVELRWFLGEWSFDTRRGTPWFRDVLGQRPTERTIRALITRQLLGVAGVAQVVSMSVSIDGTTGYCEVSDVVVKPVGSSTELAVEGVFGSRTV